MHDSSDVHSQLFFPAICDGSWWDAIDTCESCVKAKQSGNNYNRAACEDKVVPQLVEAGCYDQLGQDCGHDSEQESCLLQKQARGHYHYESRLLALNRTVPLEVQENAAACTQETCSLPED